MFRLFFGAFSKLRKATNSFVMSGHPSDCPHGTTRLSAVNGRISWNLLFEYFVKIWLENSRFINVGQE